jgi:hypothetical protein
VPNCKPNFFSSIFFSFLTHFFVITNATLIDTIRLDQTMKPAA